MKLKETDYEYLSLTIGHLVEDYFKIIKDKINKHYTITIKNKTASVISDSAIATLIEKWGENISEEDLNTYVDTFMSIVYAVLTCIVEANCWLSSSFIDISSVTIDSEDDSIKISVQFVESNHGKCLGEVISKISADDICNIKTKSVVDMIKSTHIEETKMWFILNWQANSAVLSSYPLTNYRAHLICTIEK